MVERVARSAADFGAAADVVDAAAAVAFGVNRTDLRSIGVLAQRGPMTAGALATAVGLSPAATTTAIARLVAAGHAQRDVDDLDRRRAVVALTDSAIELIDLIYGPLERAGRELLHGYSDDELTLIDNFLRLGLRLQLDRASHVLGTDHHHPPNTPPPT